MLASKLSPSQQRRIVFITCQNLAQDEEVHHVKCSNIHEMMQNCNSRQYATNQWAPVGSRVMTTLVRHQDQEHRSKIQQRAAAALLFAEWCSEPLPTDLCQHPRLTSASLWRHPADRGSRTSCIWNCHNMTWIILTLLLSGGNSYSGHSKNILTDQLKKYDINNNDKNDTTSQGQVTSNKQQAVRKRNNVCR